MASSLTHALPLLHYLARQEERRVRVAIGAFVRNIWYNLSEPLAPGRLYSTCSCIADSNPSLCTREMPLPICWRVRSSAVVVKEVGRAEGRSHAPYSTNRERQIDMNQDKAQSDVMNDEEQDVNAQERRENAKRIFRASGLPQMLQSINTTLLKGRGHFEEYDSMVLFRWGTGYTRRHMWLEVVDDTIRFRMRPHLKCKAQAPVCDGEYHIFTPEMWSQSEFLQAELKKYYDRPVHETTAD